MKKIIAILSLFLLVFSVSCKKPEEVPVAPVTPEPTPLEIAQEHIDLGEYKEAYDILITLENEEAQNLLSHFSFKPDKITDEYSWGYLSTQTYEYDEHGNILKKVHDNNGSIITDEYKYDEFGRLIQKNHDQNNYIQTYYSWNEDGKLLKEISQKNGAPYVVVECKYDEQGNKIYSRTEAPSHKIESIMEYNENGDMTLLKTESEPGTKTEKTFEYDEDGRLTKEVFTEFDYDIVTIHEYEYTDSTKTCTMTENGKVIMIRESTLDDKLLKEEYPSKETGLITLEHEYTDTGLVKSVKVVELDSEGKEHYQNEVYEYDEDGKLLITTDTYSSGDVYTREYTYHENGQKKSQTLTHNGEVTNESFYNEKGLVTKTVSSNSIFEYTYDEYGNLLTMSDSISKDSHVYEGYKLYYNPHDFDNSNLN